MSRHAPWTDKLVQLLHDPFLKAWCQGETAKEIARRLGRKLDGDLGDHFLKRFAQDKVGELLSQRLLGDELVAPARYPSLKDGERLAEALETGLLPAPLVADHAATGADRPVLGAAQQVYVKLWEAGRDHVTITHPLAAAPLKLPTPASLDGLWTQLSPAVELLDRYRATLGPLQRPEDRHRRAFLLAWRRLPEDLAREDGRFWPLQPADTRCPDHSIWDHLRVTSSLAFLPDSQAADDRVKAANQERLPWLLSMWVGPARNFVGLARTGRDLWTGSTMLAELAWAMMQPLVEALGPDAVIYPDLRANPRADRWLAEADPAVLSSFQGTRASLIPNRFVAVVPASRAQTLARAGREAVEARWGEMTNAVRAHLAHQDRLGGGPGWQKIFDAQVKTPPITRWAAVPWTWDGRSDALKKLKRADVTLPPIFPFTKDPTSLPKPLAALEAKRKERFSGWVDGPTWTHYQAARWTFLQTHPGYLLSQRGFDYPLHHHLLLATLDGRKRLGDATTERAEPGEKCTLCGARQALTDGATGTVGRQREQARLLWQKVDPEGLGAERLCGVCAVRRFLSDSGDEVGKNWRSTVHPLERSGQHTVPFPSTGLVAGQAWLDALCERYPADPALQDAVQRFVRAFRGSPLPRTQFAGALPRLRRRLHAGVDRTLRALLEIDIQYLDPGRWDRLKAQGVVDADPATDAKQASRDIQRRRGAPPTHLAVILLDGDQMGRLLLGAPDRIGARWRDVLHPDAVATLQKDPKNGKLPTWKAAWRSTLEARRLVGPSLHAFISRALRHFSNRVLPWVVEREHGGRLIYAGGDDALILCPAEDALALITRLDELFTAPWLLDRHPEATTWVTAEPPAPLYVVGSHAARARFEPIEGNAAHAGRVIPMLGPQASFSAGMAFGHFKTSLRFLRAEAAAMQRQAKDAGGRRVGLSWSTRGGAKVHAVAPLDRALPGSVSFIQAAAMRFCDGGLPGRLPYKLREVAPLARAARSQLDDDLTLDVLAGLVRRAMDGPGELAEEIARAWLDELTRPDAPDAPGEGVPTLLFARALARHLPSDERGTSDKKRSEAHDGH